MIILGTNSIKDTGFDVANSCRFNSASDDYLNRTPSSSGNRKTWTFSTWFKKCKLGVQQRLFSVQESGDERLGLYFSTSDQIVGELRFGGEGGTGLYTTQLFRDMSAWYHVVWSVDTTQSTNTNRAKLYINGEQITSFSESGYPTQNANTATNYTVEHRIGKSVGFNNPLDGYMAETVLIDGQALDPTSFGEFDEDSGIWKPIDVSGLTFGTNGFYLDFEDSSALGNDAAGSNNFTVNNLTAIDSVSDVPTNNFATLNPLTSFAGTFEEGNLKTTGSDDTVSTIGLTSGKWYWEAQRTNTSNQAHFGIGCSNGFFSATSVVSNGDYVYIRGDATYGTASRVGGITSIGSNGGTPATFTTGDILSFSLDLDSATKNITIKKNNGGTPLVDTDFSYDGSIPIFVYSRMNSGVGASFNFGNPATTISSGNSDGNGYGNMEYSIPSGYYVLNSKNLAEYG